MKQQANLTLDVKIIRLKRRVRCLTKKLNRQTEGSNSSQKTIKMLDKNIRRLRAVEQIKERF